jgi:hypothetical protein
LLAFEKQSSGGKKLFLLSQEQQEELIKTLIKYEAKFISQEIGETLSRSSLLRQFRPSRAFL